MNVPLNSSIEQLLTAAAHRGSSRISAASLSELREHSQVGGGQGAEKVDENDSQGREPPSEDHSQGSGYAPGPSLAERLQDALASRPVYRPQSR